MVQVFKNRYQGLAGQTIQLIIEVKKKRTNRMGDIKIYIKELIWNFRTLIACCSIDLFVFLLEGLYYVLVLNIFIELLFLFTFKNSI